MNIGIASCLHIYIQFVRLMYYCYVSVIELSNDHNT